jgi:ubiquinone/menaquinone biosynthesis C-methylase UbiE
MALCSLYDNLYLAEASLMNLAHRLLCSSNSWKKTVEAHVMPWVLEGIQMGSNVLEVGPGPGVTTELLQPLVQRLTCVEIDRGFAASLSQRMKGKNVTVVREDATAMSFADASFDGALSFTMLHHVPSAALQDRLLAEVARVLRPGGVFAGVDSLNSSGFRLLHLFDTMVIVEPGSFPKRLEAAGFVDVQVDVNPYAFRFRARRPVAAGC